MNKYSRLWEYIQKNGSQNFKLTFEEIQNIAGIPIDHSFLKYKKELLEYGYSVEKISMKKQTVAFCQVQGLKRKATAVLYIHGKGGNAVEYEHYRPLFPNCDVIGLDYKAETPWEATEEFSVAFDALESRYDDIILIANSIGAYFSMHALTERKIEKAYFISPVADMEKLISDMMNWANVSETELKEAGTVKTAFGETLSWEYLCYVRNNPIRWDIPTKILYGGQDNLTSRDTISCFAATHHAELKVMEQGEHWFHTPEQMIFLDNWIRENEKQSVLETDRLRIYPSTSAEMEMLIRRQTDAELKTAYQEILNGALQNPIEWNWYAIWMIELKNGTHIGDLNFKGITADGMVEIGYVIQEEQQRKGYATEAVTAIVNWAAKQPRVSRIEAETEPNNAASQRVLAKCGFAPNGVIGQEGPRFVWEKSKTGICIGFGTKQDIESWMCLVSKVSCSFPGLENEEALEEHKRTVLEFMHRQEAVCAKADKRIVGVLLFSRERNELCFLAVDPASRRRHIGEAMIQFMLALMDPNKDITVTTYRDGIPEGIAARAFYQKLGFQPGRLTEEFGSVVQEFVLKR